MDAKKILAGAMVGLACLPNIGHAHAPRHDGYQRPGPGVHQPPGQGINHRQLRQLRRIEDGVMRGDLTREEAQQLIQRQRELRRKKQFYASDGRLTVEERRELHQDLEAISREIYIERHDLEQQ